MPRLKTSPLKLAFPGPPDPRSSSGAVHRSSASISKGLLLPTLFSCIPWSRVLGSSSTENPPIPGSNTKTVGTPLPLLHKRQYSTPCWWPPTARPTFWVWLWPGGTVEFQELFITMVSDLQHKAAVHHTVPGLEAPMGETPMVQIPHTLGGGM